MRRLVLASAGVLAPAGLVLVLSAPFAAAYKTATAFAWLLLCGYEGFCHWRAYSRSGILRIDSAGQVARLTGAGEWQAVSLAGGTVVTARLAWLRVSAGRGARYGELFFGARQESQQWRRFQLIWRHIGAA